MFLVLLLAFALPRVVLGLMWYFGDRVDPAFDSVLWPILGLVFLPWGTIMYAVVWEPVTGVSENGWLVVLGAVAIDLITWASRLARTNRPYG